MKKRTGFPKNCPTGRAIPVLAANCLGCEFRKQDGRLHWRCDHTAYQDEPGIHFCLGCGIELCFGGSPNVRKNQWPYCGGPSGKCRKDMGLGGLSIAAPVWIEKLVEQEAKRD